MKPTKSSIKDNLAEELDSFSKDERDALLNIWSHATDSDFPGINHQKLSKVTDTIQNLTQEAQGTAPQAKIYRLYYFAAAASIIVACVTALLYLNKVSVFNPDTASFVVDMYDGTHIELNKGAELYYTPLLHISNRKVRFSGEAFFHVASDDKPFIIETQQGHIEVLGTSFSVKSSNDAGGITEVNLIEGSVKLTADGKSVILAPGESSTIVGGMPPSPPIISSHKQLPLWREKMLTFEAGITLETAIQKLGNAYDLNISVDDDSLLNINLPFQYNLNQPTTAQALLSDLCFMLGLQYQPTANGFELSQTVQ